MNPTELIVRWGKALFVKVKGFKGWVLICLVLIIALTVVACMALPFIFK